MFSALARRLNIPTLILAHRDELIEQAVDKLRTWWPGVDVGVVKGARQEWRRHGLTRAECCAGAAGFRIARADEQRHAAAVAARLHV